MSGDLHAGCRREGTNSGAGEATCAVGAMKPRHDSPAETILQRGSLSVHRYVDHPGRGAPCSQGGEELPGRAGDARQGEQYGERHERDLDHPAGADLPE